jgi:hypothetical protein
MVGSQVVCWSGSLYLGVDEDWKESASLWDRSCCSYWSKRGNNCGEKGGESRVLDDRGLPSQ